MARHEFMLKLNRDVTAEEVDALYEAGCGDAGVDTGRMGTLVDFDREAASLAEAIASAVRDIEKVPGLRATGVVCNNMVTLVVIARRAGVTREAVRLWTTGQRGGGFPAPVLITTGGEQVWDWVQVADWFEEHRGRTQTAAWSAGARVLVVADRVLAARDALMSEPDDSVRKEFERLLEDA